MAPQLTQQLDTVEPGQFAVGDHQIGQPPLAAGQSGLAVADLQHARIAPDIEHQLLQQVGSPGVGLGD